MFDTKHQAVVRGTVCYRDLVTIRRDAAPGGASQPQYTQVLADSVLAEILEVSGGEQVRGKQVEANTRFVVTTDPTPGVDQRCQVELLTGPYAGQKIYVGRIHYEHARSRPQRVQLHCGLSSQGLS